MRFHSLRSAAAVVLALAITGCATVSEEDRRCDAMPGGPGADLAALVLGAVAKSQSNEERAQDPRDKRAAERRYRDDTRRREQVCRAQYRRERREAQQQISEDFAAFRQASYVLPAAN